MTFHVGDPELLVFDEFLHQCITHPEGLSGYQLTLNHTDDHFCHPATADCFIGSILRHKHLIYRINEYQYDSNSWWARWPD